jgi:major membrane immunogen (membrane-anchored lipoprotein)
VSHVKKFTDNHVKRFTALAVVLVLVFTLAACAGGGSQKAVTSGSGGDGSADTSAIKMGRINYAPHGTKSFAVVVVAMQGDKIVGASIDEYQFLSTDVAEGVPNSDKTGEGDFGTNFKDPNVVLASKRDNAEYYSEHMKEAAGATTPINESYDAIEKYTVGKTVAELEDVLGKKSAEEMVDAVSGATLVDTKGYVTAIVEAAKTIE